VSTVGKIKTGMRGKHRRQSWGASRDPRFWDWVMGSVGSPRNIIVSYKTQEYEMRTPSKVMTFQK